MKSKQKAIIIGAGIGGLTTAINLAHKGYKVSIFEKNPFPGGRCSCLKKMGHRFDIGATLLMMPHICEQTYAAWGKDFNKEIVLYQLDPVYSIKFYNKDGLFFTSDQVKMMEQLEKIETGSYRRFVEYLDEGFKTYKLSMRYLIEKNFYGFFDFFSLKNTLLFLKLNAFKNHYRYIGKFFNSEILRIAFTYQNIYAGQNPYSASAVYSILPILELTDGVWFPRGGMFKLVENLLSIAQEFKVDIQYSAPVQEIPVRNKKAEGIVLQDGSLHPGDIIISNADLPYTYGELLGGNYRKLRYKKMKHTCSAIVFHWGLDKVYPQLEQHTVFISKDFKKSIKEIFNHNTLPVDPSFYVHSPAQSDNTAAPVGQDSISVIIPVGHLDNKNTGSWTDLKLQAREAVLHRLSAEGMNDLESHIKFETCYTPETWNNLLNVSRGSIFGSLKHNLLQMGYLRPHNQHRKIRNLFFVGGSTHPGSGVPLSLVSARLTTEKILYQMEQMN